MYVVRTVSQLEEALRESAREVMVVGALAPKIVEIKDSADEKHKREFAAQFYFTNVFDKFNLLAVRDNGKNVIAAVFQKRSDFSPSRSEFQRPLP